MWFFIGLIIFIIGFFIICAIEANIEDTAYARITNRPSNVVMRGSDTKLAEFKRGDKGQIFNTQEVIKVVNNYPNKYFNVVFENGKSLLVNICYIKWVSYIEDENIKDTDKLGYLV